MGLHHGTLLGIRSFTSPIESIRCRGAVSDRKAVIKKGVSGNGYGLFVANEQKRAVC